MMELDIHTLLLVITATNTLRTLINMTLYIFKYGFWSDREDHTSIFGGDLNNFNRLTRHWGIFSFALSLYFCFLFFLFVIEILLWPVLDGEDKSVELTKIN